MSIKTIACFGSGLGSETDPGYQAMLEVGRLLAQRNCQVLTGGFGGVGMEAPAKGATENGGDAIGYTFLGKPGNAFLSMEVDCRTQCAKNAYVCGSKEEHVELPPEVQFGVRLGNLLTADGFIVAANGGPGTMVELMAYINLSGKLWTEKKKLAILKVTGMGGAGWDNEMLYHFQKWGILPQQTLELIRLAKTPAQAVAWAIA